MSSTSSCLRYNWKELCMPRCTPAVQKEIAYVYGGSLGYPMNYYPGGYGGPGGYYQGSCRPHHRKRHYYYRHEY